MEERTPALRVLLAEDDPVSARFLAEALGLLGAAVETFADGPSALAAATARHYDLLLVDLGLPGLDGSAVLHSLRADAGAASRTTRAIATSAGAPAEATLLAAGFHGLLRKPATLETIARIVGQRAPAIAEPSAGPDAPALDDAAALAALGGMDAVVDLRRLLAAELPGQLNSLRAALGTDDVAAARGILHRLHASTRFCGAVALAVAGSRLQRALEDGPDTSARAAALTALDAAAAGYLRRVSR